MLKRSLFLGFCKIASYLFKIKKRVFVYRDKLSDSPRFIFEAIHKNYPDFELVWMTNNFSHFKNTFEDYSYIRFVRYSALRFVKYLLTSYCIINTQEFSWHYLAKRKKQFFVQTYHGDRGPKKVLLDEGVISSIDINDSKLTDLAIAGSKFGEERYKTAFNYFGDVLTAGMPRNDCLIKIDFEKSRLIREKHNLIGKKVVLYAPTFRDTHSLVFNSTLDLESIYSSFGGSVIILVRMHSVVKQTNISFNDHIIDISQEPDIADYLMIADYLISDYSATSFDYALTGKPVVLFLPDYEEYTHNCRNLMFDLKKIGFYCAETSEQICELLTSVSLDSFKKADEVVLSYFGTNETGTSSSEVAKIINSKYESNFKRK